MSKFTSFSIRMDPETHQELKVCAVENSVSMSALVYFLISEFLDDYHLNESASVDSKHCLEELHLSEAAFCWRRML